MSSISYPYRKQTERIVIHLLAGYPEAFGLQELETLFAAVGFAANPFHFVQTPDGDIHDSRDVREVGGFLTDSIDIAVLCVSQRPSAQQQTNLDALISALLLDYSEAPPKVITNSQTFKNTA